MFFLSNSHVIIPKFGGGKLWFTLHGGKEFVEKVAVRTQNE